LSARKGKRTGPAAARRKEQSGKRKGKNDRMFVTAKKHPRLPAENRGGTAHLGREGRRNRVQLGRKNGGNNGGKLLTESVY